MTLQSCSNNIEDGAGAGPSCSSSTSSMEVCNMPLGQQRHHDQIEINHEGQNLFSFTDEFPLKDCNINSINSPYSEFGNKTSININGRTTIHINNGREGETPPSIENGTCVEAPPSPQPPPDTGTKKPPAAFSIIKRHFKALIIVITSVTLICAVTLITLRFVGPGDRDLVTTTTPSTTTDSSTTTEEPTVTSTSSTMNPLIHYMFNRSAWGARGPTTPSVPMEPPIGLMIIKHTNAKSCQDVSSCFTAMQDLQNSDVGEHGLNDIRYNFVVGGDGNIYEGRGWRVQNAQKTDTIDVAFMGNFNVMTPSDFVVATGPWLITKGVSLGYLSFGTLKVVGHNQTEDTDSPGEFLYKAVVKWPFYSNEIFK